MGEHRHTHTQITEHTLTCLCSFWAFFQCYIVGSKTTKLFMKPSIYDSMVGTMQ